MNEPVDRDAPTARGRGAGRILAIAAILAMAPLQAGAEGRTAEERIVAMLAEDAPYHVVPPSLFNELGWDLPDGGKTVKALADETPGGALDPRRLEAIPAKQLGYRARWHELRFRRYRLDWDISGLQLEPLEPVPGLPTIVLINGGAANWYEFYFDPLNRPGLGQYLAQKVSVLLVSIPGNYRHGGWAEDDFAERTPGYLLDRDVSKEEAVLRNAVYTFRVVTEGVRALVERAVDGPLVVVGHSTGGEVQFMLHQSPLRERMQGLSLGWGTGGPAGSASMRSFRGVHDADDYLHVSRLRPRTPDQYAGGYLGPLNPFWDSGKSRLAVARDWIARVQRRRPQFKQLLQDMEHRSTDYLREHVASQIREALRGNTRGINAEAVVNDLFSTMNAPLTGYERMIWTTARLDTGHWSPEDPQEARELQVANEFREANPDAQIRVLLFDVPMTHYGHIEKPRQLAGGLVAALRWLSAM